MTQVIKQIDLFTYYGDEDPNGWLRGKMSAVYVNDTNNKYYKWQAEYVWTEIHLKSDWAATSGYAQILNKQMIGKEVVGTVVKENSFRVVKSVAVASGVAVFHLTDDGLATGNALFTEVYQDSIQLIVNDATASYQFGYALSNSNKTLTVTCNKLTTSNILTGVLGQTQANGSVVRLIVDGK